jgi:hypothetical protein
MVEVAYLHNNKQHFIYRLSIRFLILSIFLLFLCYDNILENNIHVPSGLLSFVRVTSL